jgi:ABC-type Fe3+/spermidine/putrescine transport system ATPase subunit
MISVEHVTARFGAFALEDICLSVDEGHYWVILGPSGSGKSLLLETIAGFHRQDAGRVVIDGRDVTDTPPERRAVGLVFQHRALFPHHSVSGNIEYGMRVRGVPADERKRTVSDLVDRLGLAGVLSRPVATLSGGEAQRVAIARALAVRPSVLLLDEPLSMVDHNARLELQAELKKIHDEMGTRTIHVTHSRDEAVALGYHCAVMLGGRIVQAGTLQDLHAHPRCPFVARFLGLDPNAAPSKPCAPACLEKPATCSPQ